MRNGIGDAGNGLEQSLDCDIAVIGAGITGALVVDALVATGQRIVVLDSRDLAQGSTAASTALLQYEIDTPLVELTRLIGAEPAMRSYRACAASFELLEKRMPELLSEASYERRLSVYLATEAAEIAGLQAEVAARRAIGLACEWLDCSALRERFGCRRPGAIVSALGAQLDPFRLTRALFAGAERHGVRRFARVHVDAVEEGADNLVLHTGTGHTVTAGNVVVCAGHEALQFLPMRIAEIRNTFALVTEPLTARARLSTMPLIWESARPYLYLRGTSDGRLIVGGEDVPFKSASAREILLPRQIRRLADKYQGLFDVELPPVAYSWAGTFAETDDGLPFIGRAPGISPRMHFALCYGGNGITFGVHAGDMVRAAIEGGTHPLDDVFGFERLGVDLAAGPIKADAAS